MRAAQRLRLAAFSLSAVSVMFVPPAIAANSAAAGTGIDPRYLLMDARGRAATNTRFPNRFQLLSFGYAASPDVGPTTLAEMAEVMQSLGERAPRVQPLFITIDPARDLPSKLQRFVNFFDTRIIGLSGNDTLTARVIDNYRLRVDIVRTPDAASDDYSVDHSTGMVLLDPAGAFLKTFPFGTPVAEITATLETLIDSAPPADAR